MGRGVSRRCSKERDLSSLSPNNNQQVRQRRREATVTEQRSLTLKELRVSAESTLLTLPRLGLHLLDISQTNLIEPAKHRRTQKLVQVQLSDTCVFDRAPT